MIIFENFKDFNLKPGQIKFIRMTYETVDARKATIVEVEGLYEKVKSSYLYSNDDHDSFECDGVFIIKRAELSTDQGYFISNSLMSLPSSLDKLILEGTYKPYSKLNKKLQKLIDSIKVSERLLN